MTEAAGQNKKYRNTLARADTMTSNTTFTQTSDIGHLMYLLNFKDTDKLSATAAYYQQLAKQSYDLIVEIIQSQKSLFKD